MKMRIDSVIENFVGKLEDKWYSEAQMTSAINTVISRLWEFKNKAGYKYIVHYMIEVLEEYRDEYSNPLEDLESIFDGL
jgi:ferritin-like metal-binding protein YciE